MNVQEPFRKIQFKYFHALKITDAINLTDLKEELQPWLEFSTSQPILKVKLEEEIKYLTPGGKVEFYDRNHFYLNFDEEKLSKKLRLWVKYFIPYAMQFIVRTHCSNNIFSKRNLEEVIQFLLEIDPCSQVQRRYF